MLKLFFHKIKHWEYWSVNFVYAPTFFYWIALMIKFRSIKFYKFSNPSIKNGGFNHDSKFEIYKLFPKNIYPKTILIEIENKYNFDHILQINHIKFPFIVKPDVGLRGINVKIINDIEELNDYYSKINENFLIQEIIEFSNEIGLFYYRFPTEKNGKISGITLKKFLTIEGDGIQNIQNLLKKNPRFEMQIPKLKKLINLNEVIAIGEKRCLVPFGNHNRGTEFLDGKMLINSKIEKTFDEILNKIDDFYYGRLDIRYNTFEELENGINFSIIELNGAKSEPTHIYDPKHSYWYGQKEIFRHQKIFQKIVKINFLLSKK